MEVMHVEVASVEETHAEVREEAVLVEGSPPRDQMISPPDEPIYQTPPATQSSPRSTTHLQAIRHEGIPSTN